MSPLLKRVLPPKKSLTEFSYFRLPISQRKLALAVVGEDFQQSPNLKEKSTIQ
jgi:hypothetical protein